MRGIQAALKILTEDVGSGPVKVFASESLRKLADKEEMKTPDISLASSLVYIVMRRKELWEHIAAKFLSDKDKLPPEVYMSIIMGTGGILELRRFSEGVLINGILEHLKGQAQTSGYVSLVNAVLRKVTESGVELAESYKKSAAIEDKALYSGIPVWSMPAWLKTWSRPELSSIFEMMLKPSFATLRVSPGPGKLDEMTKLLEEKSIRYAVSEISGGIRLNGSVLPTSVPGYASGLCTVQSESSILAGSVVKKFYSEGAILDMCSGRGVKAGQIMQDCPDAKLECWDIAEARLKSAEREFSRLGLTGRATVKVGDAVTLSPEEEPSFVVLDAPCSCSGTWTRKPESKWRLDWQKFDGLTGIQNKLLDHAVNICKEGGYILYITCSLLKPENESVVAQVLANHPECADVSGLIGWKGSMYRRGKPYGTYILPYNSWLDGFYCALILRRSNA